MSLIVCDRISDKSSRYRIENVIFSNKVSSVRARLSKNAKLPTEDIEIIFAGRCLQDDETLESYGLKSGGTVFLMRKVTEQKDTEKKEVVKQADVVRQLQTSIVNSAYKHGLDRMLRDPTTAKKLLEMTPGLYKDPIAFSIIRDKDMLIIMADPTIVNKVFQEHPCLIDAAQNLVKLLNARVHDSRPTPHTSSGAYSLDQMSDDEDFSVGPASRPRQGQITQNFFAQALAAVQQPSTSRSPQSRAPSLSQAIQQATVSGPLPPSEDQMDAALQQMRDMGISDVNAARRALEATGGNVQAALGLLFGDVTV